MPAAERSSPLHMVKHMTDRLLESQVEMIEREARHRVPGDLYVLELRAEEYVHLQELSHMAHLIARGRELAQAALPEIRARFASYF